MLPFDLLFMDVARKESRAVGLTDPRGQHVGSFLFREYFCNESGCDCGIVLIHAVWAERRQVAATFSYIFEPFPEEPQLELDPMGPQSDLSTPLLQMFERSLAEDAAYRPALLRHYAMWRSVVDDPSHPDHSKLGGRVQGAPPAEREGGGAKRRKQKAPVPATKRAKPPAPRVAPVGVPKTAARGGASRPSPTGVELVARMAPKAESKRHQRFRKLLEKVDQLKQRHVAWREGRAAIDSEIASLQAVQRRNDELTRRMAFLLDGARDKLSKRDRSFVRELIEELAGDLLRKGDVASEDQELKSLYERHAQRKFADEQARQAADMLSMLEELGLELDKGLDLGTPEAVMASVQGKLEALEEEQSRAGEERRARRKQSVKQIAAADKRAQEERDAHKAVQDVYRQLARSVHPDREKDPVERDRKTNLLQEINAAYERRDLLALLELQLKIEGVEGEGSIESLAEERLVRYIRVLDEQTKQLTVELDAIEMPFRLHLDRGPRAAITPAAVLDAIRAEMRSMESVTEQLAKDLSLFEDIERLKQWVKEQRSLERPMPIFEEVVGPNDIPF